MTTVDDSTQLDLHEQIARINCSIAETDQYAAKEREPETEARNLDRNRWQVVVIAMTAGPAFVWCRRCFYEAGDWLTLMSDASIDRLEARLARIEEAIIRIEARLAITVPHLATKTELSDKPDRHYNWRVRAAMTAAFTAALAAGATGAIVIAIILTYLPHH
jgi:hypothetical protein